ncbi:MAG: DUF4846 domain-containing protein [Eubacterium sp.]|nr:DUF4846 domain-containing protein [Eubacterium sp.]
MRHRMTEKDAIMISTVLGAVVLTFVLVLCRPFSWGSDTEVAVSGGSANASQVAVSGGTIFGGTVSGGVIGAGGGEIINEEGMTLETRVNPPAGFQRVKVGRNSFGSFLRGYKLKKAGAKVKLYNGKNKQNQDAHAAVFKLPIEKEDLQQCADSVIRMYAEYFWETEQYDNISFQFADGFQADYIKWRQGYRIRVAQSTSWISGGGYDASYENFKKYLRMVFAYSSTLSQERESKKIRLSAARAGDIFIQGGSPGHVVMIVDVCEDAAGKKAFLLAQGYMPAQQFQLLKNPAHEQDGDPWYYEDEIRYPLQTPEYDFKKGSLKRPEYLSE